MPRPVVKSDPHKALPIAPRRGPAPEEDKIYELITEGIVKQQIRPGDRLKESILAEQFGVSRARVRRVLYRLSELDVVEFKLNFGAMVSRPSPSNSKAVFATRRVLEAEAVRSACEVATRKDFRLLRQSVVTEEIAFKRQEPGVAALSSQFHLKLGGICGNPVLARILNPLVHRCVLIQSLYQRNKAPTICLIDEHKEILALMEKGKSEAAIAAMANHLDHIMSSLQLDVDEPMDRRVASAIR